LAAGLPVVTMDSELQLTCGTILARKGIFVEAEGTSRVLSQLSTSMFAASGFLDRCTAMLNVSEPESRCRGNGVLVKRQGITLDQVTAFTDGTKYR